MLTNGALLGLGIVELAIFVQLLYYNQNAYKQWLLDNKWVQTLSQRYQVHQIQIYRNYLFNELNEKD